MGSAALNMTVIRLIQAPSWMNRATESFTEGGRKRILRLYCIVPTLPESNTFISMSSEHKVMENWYSLWGMLSSLPLIMTLNRWQAITGTPGPAMRLETKFITRRVPKWEQRLWDLLKLDGMFWKTTMWKLIFQCSPTKHFSRPNVVFHRPPSVLSPSASCYLSDTWSDLTTTKIGFFWSIWSSSVYDITLKYVHSCNKDLYCGIQYLQHSLLGVWPWNMMSSQVQRPGLCLQRKSVVFGRSDSDWARNDQILDRRYLGQKR